MSINKIKFGVIGFGSIGKRHAAVINECEDAQLSAISDSDSSKESDIRLYSSNIPFFINYTEMLTKMELDVVCICTPHFLHAPMTINCLKAGKHVLVEKPMALLTSDAKLMNQTAKEEKLHLLVVKQNRYNIPIKYLTNALQESKLGKIWMVQCNVIWNRNQLYYTDSDWRGHKKTEGGALYTQVSHFIDLLIWWFGDVVNASTTIKTFAHNIEIEDAGVSNIEFNSGVVASVFWTTCSYNKNFEGSITIIGEKGTVKIGGQYLNKIEYWDVESFPLQEGIDYTDKPNIYSSYQGTSSNHDKVIKDMIDLLRNKKNSSVHGEEAIKTIEAIELIYKNTDK